MQSIIYKVFKFDDLKQWCPHPYDCFLKLIYNFIAAFLFSDKNTISLIFSRRCKYVIKFVSFLDKYINILLNSTFKIIYSVHEKPYSRAGFILF